ncbi:MAG: hypothetical protein FWF44_01250 [Defluviitaleaceae bacterium]|nr:hypothetical protein [Defluviitaleaceae bacterium]
MDKIGLLREKKDIFENMLAMTKRFTVTGGDADVDEYAALMARRRGLISKAKAIEEELERVPSADRRGEDALAKEIAETVRAIIARDGEISAKIPEVVDMIKKRLKDISATRSISSSYNYGESARSGLLFDSKN